MTRDDDPRQGDRRRTQRRENSRDLVPVDTPAEPAARPASPAARPSADPAFSAQLMGQDGQKRGLKGGAPVLDAARSTYLGREYSGSNERRPTAGKTTKTEI